MLLSVARGLLLGFPLSMLCGEKMSSNVRKTMERKITCNECGAIFVSHRYNQAYCSKKCGKVCNRRRARTRAKNIRFAQRQEADSIEQRPPTDWVSIGRLCAETGKSYGQLVCDGLL